CIAIMGASGAGKSTLALAAAGLLTPAAGTRSGAAAGDVRMVLQRPESTFLESTVLDEVALAARWSGVGEPAARASADAALRQLGLPDGIGDADPLALSGGEQRRVAIAAVLAGDPRVLVLDEPAAGLDAAARVDLVERLRQLHAAGRTVLVVTHDAAEAALLADRLVVLVDGRIAYDGPTGDVLGDPARAHALGLEPAPEVRALHVAATARGVVLAHHPARPDAATAALVDLLRAGPPPLRPAAPDHAQPPRADAGEPEVMHLPRAIDARVRLGATALAVAAALIAHSLVAVAIVVAATLVVLASARVGRARLRTALRPVVALGIALVALQLLLGGAIDVELWPGREVSSGTLAAVVRILQVLAIIAATLVLTARTSTVDLAAAMARLLAPLRGVRVPVDELALVVATGLGFVPVLADELERLRLAQAARGIGARGRGPLARARVESMLLVPLFVLAFRRAHLLAEALAVRGYDPRAARTTWRPRSTPTLDVALLASGMLLVVVALLA
ncbi:MAG: transporter related protein, partial [Thermoleophilia bacterium]|nr:transporter related protein [Thermoleophilia bacterium]